MDAPRDNSRIAGVFAQQNNARNGRFQGLRGFRTDPIRSPILSNILFLFIDVFDISGARPNIWLRYAQAETGSKRPNCEQRA